MEADVPEIVVVAPLLPEAPGEATYSTIEIDPAAIYNAVRLDEALRGAPGVSLFRRNDSVVSNPTIQGLSIRSIAPSGAGRALVTLDGQPMNDPFGGWVIWGALPTETIAAATVLRGGGAGPYGAGALTGAVNLRERRGQGATLTFEFGERGFARLAGVGEARGESLSFMLGASAQMSDGWVPVHAGRGAADIALAAESFAGVTRLEWRGDDLIIAARLGAYSEWRSAGLVGADSTSEGTSLSFSLAEPRGAFAWRLQAWALHSNLANTSVTVAPDRGATTPANDQIETPALGWGGNAALRWTSDSGGIELGADLRTADGETNEVFAFSGGQFTRSRIAGGRALTAGVYAEGWRHWENWLLSGGVRVDLTRAENGRREERLLATGAATLAFTPDDSETIAPTARLGARRALGEHFFHAAAYAGFRPPTLNELHRPFRVGNDVTEANAALKPERMFGADMAIGGDYDAWSWSAGAFAARLDDAIVNVTLGAGSGVFPPGVFVPAGGAYRQRRNAGRIDAIGLEIDAHGAVSGALSWRAALTYTDAAFDGGPLDRLRPAQSPELSLSAGVNWRAAPSTLLSADLLHESMRFEDDLNSRELSAATVLNVRVERTLAPNVSLYAAIDNAFDSEIETAETATGIESFGSPRAFRLGFRLHTP